MKKKMKLPKKKFKVLYVDPPWRTEAYTKARSGTPRRIDGDHYPTMTLEELKAVPIEDIAARECALFMWVIDTHLDQALELAAHWGFRYSSVAFVWRKLTKHGKDHFGMGKTTRKQLEMVLLFMKTPPKRQSAAVRQFLPAEWVDAKTRQHSRKPDEVYARIEALYEGPYCELFARQEWPGRSVAGNETQKFKPKSEMPEDLATLFGESRKKLDDDISRMLG